MRRRYAIASALIGLGFLVIAILSFLNTGGSTMAGTALLRSIAGGPGLFWLHIAGFLLALTLLYGLLGWLMAWLGQGAAERLISREDEQKKAVFLLFLMAHLWVILESAAQFPNSTLGVVLHDLATLPVVRWATLGMGGLILVALAVGAIHSLLHSELPIRARSGTLAAIVVATSLLIGAWHWMNHNPTPPFPTDEARPHVILIGIDGWRADTMPQWGGDAGRMPFTENLIHRSAYFEDALTPNARSFPAWWTILTGQYPPTHGARINLIDESLIRSRADLPIQLGKRGYHRIFAIDERRFAAIREAHGFDQLVGPGVGAADFLVGGLNDTPLGNLLVNTTAGRWLFPFSHANRAVDELYRPETFDELLSRTLEKAPREPLFLATHFELPHWPYTWADRPSDRYFPHPLGIQYARYLESLERVDEQMEFLFRNMEELGILENALVVILSDHGESFPLEDRTWHHPTSDAQFTPPPGHGTSFLSLSQSRVPVAFQWFGKEPIPPGQRPGRISLADIYPTISELIELEPGHQVDGRSLVGSLLQPGAGLESQAIPLETGLNVGGLASGFISPQRLLGKAFGYYHIKPNGLVHFKPEYVNSVMSEKRRGVIKGQFIAAPFIVNAEEPFIAWRIADINRREFWDEIHPIPEDSPYKPLTEDFCDLFANDLEYLPEAACANTTEP